MADKGLRDMDKKPKKLEFKVNEAQNNFRLDKFLTLKMASLSASRRKIRDHIDRGAVYVEKKRVHVSSRSLISGQTVQIIWGPDEFKSPIEKMPWSQVEKIEDVALFENDDFLVINKPRGLPCQATKSNSRDHAGPWTEKLFGSKLHLIHRLDQWTSGALAFAKSKSATERGMSAFKSRSVDKIYHCISIGKSKQSLGVAQGTWKELQHNLLKPDQATITVRVVGWRDKRGKEAILKARELGQVRTEANIPLSLLEVKPETGRTHQIRVQLATIDLPILGDGKYGTLNSTNIQLGNEGLDVEKGQYLHARKLSIPSLSIKAVADYPKSWAKMLALFEADKS